MNRPVRFLTALVRYRDVHYAKRLLARAAANLRLVGGALGARYLRIDPYRDFGGVPDGTCERFEVGRQPAGFVRMNLAPYHLVLDEAADRVVVEAGCNEGYGAALLARRARQVHAFDVSEAAIAAARRHYARANVTFAVHDVSLPFPLADASVDLVFSSETIEHLREGRGFIAAAARVLKPDGTLVIKTPNDAYNRLENRLNPFHTNPYDARRLRAELEAAFERVAIEGITYRTDLVTAPEDRPEPAPPEARDYRFGDPIEVDRVLVTRMVVTPRCVAGNEVPEYLFARASRPRAARP
ncbi:MAG: class I SAM-dependent methyltransferase [Candidatus Eisenbacteria bacterium]|nr:class I SAM-dependent methyltransferase [Candidatus Eisenbacteria bacterium]